MAIKRRNMLSSQRMLKSFGKAIPPRLEDHAFERTVWRSGVTIRETTQNGGKSYEIVLDGPPGDDQFYRIVSEALRQAESRIATEMQGPATGN